MKKIIMNNLIKFSSESAENYSFYAAYFYPSFSLFWSVFGPTARYSFYSVDYEYLALVECPAFG